jgi:CheY-like chemotaxis protein
MKKNVLLVDDDKELIETIKEGLEKHEQVFSVMLAEDGVNAAEKLKKNPVALVVTDLKMPRADGFILLKHIMKNYPDIPVIIMTAYSTSEKERLAKEGGAIEYISKPFIFDDLAGKILTTLKKQSDGGELNSISSGMFLQLIEMEEKTCTIRITDKSVEDQGVLFFKKGELLDARFNTLKGESAALEIFSWDEVNISIQNKCYREDKRIQRDLQAILMDAMRLKDEKDDGEEQGGQIKTSDDAAFDNNKTRAEPSAKANPAQPELENNVRNELNVLKEKIGFRSDVEEIYHDNSWNKFIGQLTDIDTLFDVGDVKLAYINRGATNNDLILLPGKDITVVSVKSNSPREELIQLFNK